MLRIFGQIVLNKTRLIICDTVIILRSDRTIKWPSISTTWISKARWVAHGHLVLCYEHIAIAFTSTETCLQPRSSEIKTIS